MAKSKGKQVDVVQVSNIPDEVVDVVMGEFVSAEDFDVDDLLGDVEVQPIPPTQVIPDALMAFAEKPEEPIDDFERAVRSLVDEHGIFADIDQNFQEIYDYTKGSLLGMSDLAKGFTDNSEEVPSDLLEGIKFAEAQLKVAEKQREIVADQKTKEWFSTILRQVILESISKADMVSLAASMPTFDMLMNKVKEATNTLVQYTNLTTRKELPECAEYMLDVDENKTPVIN